MLHSSTLAVNGFKEGYGFKETTSYHISYHIRIVVVVVPRTLASGTSRWASTVSFRNVGISFLTRLTGRLRRGTDDKVNNQTSTCELVERLVRDDTHPALCPSLASPSPSC
jgi:hypothetical protein